MKKDAIPTLADLANEEIAQKALAQIKNMLRAGYKVEIVSINGKKIPITPEVTIKMTRR